MRLRDWRDVLEHVYGEHPSPWDLLDELVALLLAAEIGR